jgi:glycolate oxidase
MNDRLLEQFAHILGPEGVLTEPVQLMTYECDALPHLRQTPAAVVLPRSAADVQAIVGVCAR